MKFVNHVIILFVSSLTGLLLAKHFVAGFSVSNSIKALLIVSAVLMLINIFIRPILKIVLSPVIFLTFGLGIIIVNAALLWLLAYLFPAYIVISSLKALLFATLIVSFVNTIITFFAKSVLRNEA
ncbi:MAG: phage holin family protein [Candidatus Paceibacterota bacterium]|jgi:putative membrane protein